MHIPKYKVTEETLDSMADYYRHPNFHLNWNCLFVIPAFLKSWWCHFNPDAFACITGIWEDNQLIGIAPLMIHRDCACFMGNPDVCDFQDFIVVPDKATLFFNLLTDHLKTLGVKSVCLEDLHPESIAFSMLPHIADQKGLDLNCVQTDELYAFDLPRTWEDYLGLLTGKQRHEVRRKLRRLEEAGEVSFNVINKNITEKKISLFLKLFQENRADKALFMTSGMEAYFKTLAQNMAQDGLLELGFLNIDHHPAGVVFCFNFQNTLYLYNNGYDAEFSHVSVGLMSKVLSIQQAISHGARSYNFLKGSEIYKKRLGGVAVPLYRMTINLD